MTESRQRDLADALRVVSSRPDVQSTLDAAVETAVDLIDGCDHAGVTLLKSGRRVELETVAADDDLARRGDELQYELGEGPCVDAVTQQVIVESPNLRRDERWPRWTSAVLAEFDVEAMLCVRMFDHERTVGAINLYGRTGPFTDRCRDEAYLLAAHVAVAVGAVRASSSLTEAIEARSLVGQAQGMLMERFDIDGEKAFAVLKRVSQHRNVKLNVLARVLVETGELPGLS